MKNTRTITAYLTITRRLPRSRNGNPRFEVLLRVEGADPDIIARTAVDSCTHYVTSNAGKTVRATIGDHYGRTTIGKVENVEELTQ
jgi:hypothetical protein